MKILIVDDETKIREVVSEYAKASGYECDQASNGKDAVQLVTENNYDCVILDIMMPELDGFSACKKIKAVKDVPVIMLSARTEEDDKLFSFDLGVDDYVTKPFSPAELTARIDALFRRVGDEEPSDTGMLVQGPFALNTHTRTLEKNGVRIKLTQVEYSIMKLFMQNPGRALSREEILSSVWGGDYDGEEKIVDVNIRRLRIKIENDTANPTFITTVWGFGYKWGA